MGLIDRLTAMVADLAENGVSGAGGATLVTAGALVLLAFAVFWAMLRNDRNTEE